MSPIDTPEGFVWLFDRGTLATLPADDANRWRDFHEEVWEALISDPSVHEGCVPADELHAVQRELRDVEKERDDDVDEARVEGYRQACADILHRVENMTARDGDGFDEARTRMADGIAKLRERGPKMEAAAA